MDVIKEFIRIAANPTEYVQKWQADHGGKIFGSFCSYTPEEIIFAGDALSYRIFGSTATLSLADTHLQAYSCSLVRGALADAKAGNLDFIDGVVFPHTCDSIQRLSDIFRLNIDYGFHADVVLPVKVNTESAGVYMIDVFRRFKKDLERAIDHEITDDKLSEAIGIYNRIRSSLEKIYRLRRDNPSAISGSELHAVAKATMVMDRRALPDMLDDVIGCMKEKDGGKATDKKRILLSGGICSMPDVYPLIEASGGEVVWDDLCTGWRYFGGMIDTQGDPLAAIARRYLKRAICPAKHSGLEDRADQLVRLAKETGADGVIFLLLKFCDPHHFDYPYLKTALDEAGVPSLVFEIEDRVPSEGQVRTRCEAFIEML